MKKKIIDWINEKGNIVLDPLINNKSFDRFSNTIFHRFQEDPLLTYAIAINWSNIIKLSDERYPRAYSLKQILEKEIKRGNLIDRFKEFEG
ncbi:MAG: hypothetical protein ABIA78_02315, partial [archaeon]